MSSPGLSLPSTSAIVDVVTGGSGTGAASKLRYGLYRSGPDLVELFGSIGIPLQIGISGRVPAVRAAINASLQSEGGRSQILKLACAALDPRLFRDNKGALEEALQHVNHALRGDGYELVARELRCEAIRLHSAATASEELRDKVDTLNMDAVAMECERALENADTDPEDSLTAACSLLESVAKTMLERLQVPLPANEDIQHLWQALRRELKLSPDRPDLEPNVRQVLGGLVSTVQGIGALRTRGGDAHGRAGTTKRVDARIAKLAVHAASAVALFTIETWELRAKRK